MTITEIFVCASSSARTWANSSIMRMSMTFTEGLRNMHEARVHAYTRFRQSYRARDLVREIALLRLTLIEHIQLALRAEPARISPDEHMWVPALRQRFAQPANVKPF